MPTYDKRPKEIEESLKGVKLEPIEIVAILPRLQGLYDGRDSALANMRGIIVNDGTEPMADDYKDKAQLALDRWITPFSKLLDGVSEPSLGADLWREAQCSLEGAFFGRLAAVGLGEARDRMIALEAGLMKLSADLQLKWDTMSSAAKALEAQEQEASRKMSEAIEQGLHDGTDISVRYSEALQKFLAGCMSIPDHVNATVVQLAKAAGIPDIIADAIPKESLTGKEYFAYGKELGIAAKDLAAMNPEAFRDPGMAVSETIQKEIGPLFEALVTAAGAFYKNTLPAIVNVYHEQMVAYRRLLPNQGVVVVSLGQTRADVEKFLAESGLDKARELYERTRSDFNAWIDRLPTEGQKADARDWGQPIGEAFKTRYERMANAYAEFIEDNKGRFIGGASQSTRWALLFTDVWADRKRSLMNTGIDVRIKDWRANQVVVSDKFQTAGAQVFRELQHLPRDIGDSITRQLNDYWSKLRDRLAAEAEIAARSLGEADAALSQSQMEQDLDRRPLESQLP